MAGKDNEWQGALAAIDQSSIDKLKALKQEQDKLAERLQAMDDLKASVPTPVYLRVREDYSQQLRKLEEEARPLQQAARDQYAMLRALLERFEADHEVVKLDQQELELRHKLGEFDDKEFQSRSKKIEGGLKETAEARARGLEVKARFLEAFHSETELETTEPPAPPAPPPAVSAATPARAMPVLGAAELAQAQARTHEVPAVQSGDSPARTQIMSAINIPEPVAAPPPPPPRPAPPPAEGATQIFRAARLVPQNPEAGKQTYTLNLKPMNIGADTSNDIRIGGPGVEAKHAKITVSMAGFTLVDLGTKHGTRVNAEKVRERSLANEDVIQIGAARFVFREG